MIIGVGVDTVQLSRFEAKLTETPRLKDRLFLDIETVDASVQTLAGRFAAKEAVIKAMSQVRPGWMPAMNQIEVRNDRLGRPSMARRCPPIPHRHRAQGRACS